MSTSSSQLRELAEPFPRAVRKPLKDGHKHARAVRIVMKAVLKDVWQAASHSTDEPQEPIAGGTTPGESA